MPAARLILWAGFIIAFMIDAGLIAILSWQHRLTPMAILPIVILPIVILTMVILTMVILTGIIARVEFWRTRTR